MVANWFAAAGVSPKFVIEVGDAGAAIELVRAGLGVTIVTSISLPEHQREGLISLPLDPIQK